jgi:hypothetical protein
MLALACVASGRAAVAQPSASEAQVKAAFVYNFLKFVEWPEPVTDARAPLVVAIMGGGATAEATAGFLASKSVGTRPIVIRRLAPGEPIGDANALFVGDGDVGRIRQQLARLKGAPVLTIGESDEFTAMGGIIAMLVEDRKVRFEINAPAGAATGLRISSKLLALARAARAEAARRLQR